MTTIISDERENKDWLLFGSVYSWYVSYYNNIFNVMLVVPIIYFYSDHYMQHLYVDFIN